MFESRERNLFKDCLKYFAEVYLSFFRDLARFVAFKVIIRYGNDKIIKNK